MAENPLTTIEKLDLELSKNVESRQDIIDKGHIS